MVPPNLKFWFILRKEIVESQRKQAPRNKFLRTPLCSNDKFNPGYKRKMLMRKRTSILDGVCVNYELLFHPVQCTACKICQCSSRDKLVLPEVTGILSFSHQLHYLGGIISFGNVTRQYSICLYQSGCLHTLFSFQYILAILGEKFLFGISLFKVWQLLLFNYNQFSFFRRSFWSCKYNLIKSQF